MSNSRLPAKSMTAEAQLLDAYHALCGGRTTECIRLINGLSTSGNPLSTSIMAAATGLLALDRNEIGEAEMQISHAYDGQSPCQVILNICASFFRSAGAQERAYEAHCLLAQFDGDAFRPYWPRLSDAQKYRYSGWRPDSEVMLDATSQCISAAGKTLLAEALGANENPSGDPTLRLAYQAIADDLPDAAMRWSARLADSACPVSQGVRLVAGALVAKRDLDAAKADRLLDDAYQLGNPLPVLLRVIGEHYRTQKAHGFRAFECFSLLERMAPGTTLPFWESLPTPERLRCTPYLIRVNLRVSGRPHMYGLLRHKQMFARQFGTLGLAILMSEMLDGKPPQGLTRPPLRGLQDYARENAQVYDVIGHPRHVSLHLPRIIGADSQEPIEGKSRTFFVCVLKNVIVSGKSNVIIASDAILMDFQDSEFEQMPAELDFNFPVLDDLGSSATLLKRQSGSAVIPEAIKLTGAETSVFGHWIMEHMFQLWALMKQPGFAQVPVLIDAQMPPQHRQAIEFFAGSDHPILTIAMGEDRQVTRLWACSKVVYWSGAEKPLDPHIARSLFELADPDLLAGLLLELQPRLDSVLIDDDTPIKLYLTRGAQQSRELDNRAEIERFFEDRGFMIVEPAELTFMEQLRLLRRATTIVLQAGSSLYSTIYCRAGAKIGYFPADDPPHLECMHEVLLRLGHKMLALAPVTNDPSEKRHGNLDLLALLLHELESDWP